jgi:mannosyl-oligosaccharide alpha-1,2-mannosidase
MSDDNADEERSSRAAPPQPASRVVSLCVVAAVSITLFVVSVAGATPAHLDGTVFAQPLAQLRTEMDALHGNVGLLGEGLGVLQKQAPAVKAQSSLADQVGAATKTFTDEVTALQNLRVQTLRDVARSVQKAAPVVQPQQQIGEQPVQQEVQAPADERPGGPYKQPKDPYADMSEAEQNTNRRNDVVDAFLSSYKTYKKYAWGLDELQPITRNGKNWNDDPVNSMSLSIIDALATLHLMGQTELLEDALKYVKEKLFFNRDVSISAFETTIRVVGSLLSIYELRGEKDPAILAKAVDIADRLLFAYNTTTGLPHQTVNLMNHRHSNPDWSGGNSVLSEFGTVQLELRTLSYHTGNPIYDMKATHITSVIESRAPQDMMCPVFISVLTANWMTDHVSVGALGDSFYEYLLKQWILTGQTEGRYKEMYETAAEAIVDKMLFRSIPSGWSYIAEYRRADYYHKMDELACFAAGMLALGAQRIGGDGKAKMMKHAGDLAHTCYLMFSRQKSGVAPEYVEFPGGQDFINGAGYYLLRPETMESMFYMWRFTKDQKYRDWGWNIFRAIDRWCRVQSGGYSGLRDVNLERPEQDNLQQSFWLAETLKYSYLLFADDDAINLDEWVFNTEAHPLKIRERDPMDVWRAYEKKHGRVPWRGPIVKDVVERETDLMKQQRLAGDDQRPRTQKDQYGEELEAQTDDDAQPFDRIGGMRGLRKPRPNVKTHHKWTHPPTEPPQPKKPKPTRRPAPTEDPKERRRKALEKERQRRKNNAVD